MINWELKHNIMEPIPTKGMGIIIMVLKNRGGRGCSPFSSEGGMDTVVLHADLMMT